MRRVLVTGASRGLGLEFVRQYLAAGDQVTAACRQPGTAAALRGLSPDAADRLSVIQLDVTDPASVSRAATEHAQGELDLLINCAGVMGRHNDALGTIDYGEWLQVLNVNLLGPARMCEAFLPRLVQASHPVVVSITSGMGSLADNSSGGYIAYRTSKAALNMLMRSAAIDLKSRGVTCVLVNPGWVKTDMGGPGATLTATQSVASMRRLIAKLGPQDSGRFFNYDGLEYPW
ncbi:MAG: SDR family oxidoreductase [Gammaproteobacteria bacterium]|nr:SDR family oxidoreductase [Gammaproteobacteria bacterium]